MKEKTLKYTEKQEKIYSIGRVFSTVYGVSTFVLFFSGVLLPNVIFFFTSVAMFLFARIIGDWVYRMAQRNL